MEFSRRSESADINNHNGRFYEVTYPIEDAGHGRPYLPGSFNLALAAEVQGGGTTMSQPMTSKLGMVTQNRLNKAHSDKNNWLHVNGGLRADPLLPRQPDRHRQRFQAAARNSCFRPR